MLRDSKKAGLQRLTDFIYEYKSYLAAPPPPPTSQPEPQPSVIQTTLNPSWSHKNDRSAVPFDSKASRLPAGGVSTVSSSGQAAAATDGVMSSISFQSDTLVSLCEWYYCCLCCLFVCCGKKMWRECNDALPKTYYKTEKKNC